MTNLNRAVASAVRDALHRRGITQSAAAAALGMSQPALSDRMRGRTPFTLADLDRLSLLGIEISEVIYPLGEAS